MIMDLGSVEPARVAVRTHSEAQHLQDLAAERCSMPYRPPELYQVDSKCDIDERTDVWVRSYYILKAGTNAPHTSIVNMVLIGIFSFSH